MLTLITAIFLAAGQIFGIPSGAPDGTTCYYDFFQGVNVCTVAAEPPADAPSGGSAGQTGASGVAKCSFQGAEVPCTSPTSGGWWYSPKGCYVLAVSPPPSLDDLVWQGQTTGGIFGCVAGPAGQPWPGSYFWLPAQPGGPGAPPDPARVARRAIDQMQLRRIAIGMVPESGPDRVGIVGIPAWMWVADRSDQTFGPITRTASSGPVSVTATARVARIVWDMGDGSKVTCTTAGTPFYAGAGGTKSPDCGYVYSKQGSYTVTATSHWEVAWSGGGQSGTIPLTMSSSNTVVIGELQAVTR